MPRINEHTFELDNSKYKLTYYRHDKPILYRNEILFSGNKSALLIEYIKQNKLPLNLFKGQTTQQLSDLVLKHFSEGNKIIIVDKISSNQSESSKVAKEKKERSLKLAKSKYNRTAEEEIDEKIKSLDWDSIKDKKKNKLLIIGCSDSKTSGGVKQIVNNYFDNENYNNLIIDRIISFHDYDNLLINSPNYFIHKSINPDTPIKRNNIPVRNNYFAECRNNNLFLPAIERYAGGTFYTQQLRELYCKKNEGSNLHILIISGLYGIIEFRDSIIDYHLKINTLNFWNNQSILESVKQYIEENKIDDNLVFYSLSNFYKKALKPNKNWKNLWISVEGARRANLGYSAKYVSKFLNRLP